MHKKIKEEINAVLFFIYSFFIFYFLQNITQSMVSNICYTTNGFTANCSDCESRVSKAQEYPKYQLFINITKSKTKERFDMKYFQFNKKYKNICICIAPVRI